MTWPLLVLTAALVLVLVVTVAGAHRIDQLLAEVAALSEALTTRSTNDDPP